MRWLPVPGYEDAYRVSDDGQVFSLSRNKLLKLRIRPNIVQIKLAKKGVRKWFSVNRLVFAVFSGPIPKGYDVVHKNLIVQDNRISNLHAAPPRSRYDRTGIGPEKRLRKLSNKQIEDIRYQHEIGIPATRIAVRLKMNYRHILSIIKKRTWPQALTTAQTKPVEEE